jgi:hypothetical protein
LAPQYLVDLVKLRDSTVLTRSAGAKHLFVPKTRTAHYGDRAFYRAGPVLWNNLPLNIRTKESLSTFKFALKTHQVFLAIKIVAPLDKCEIQI